MNEEFIKDIKEYQFLTKVPNNGPTTKFLDSLYSALLEKEKQGHQLVVNAMPKSGSTYLTHLLRSLTKYHEVVFHLPMQNSEPTMFYHFLIDLYNKNYVMHHHYKASAYHIFMYNKFNIKPIILTRNIYDVVLSFTDSVKTGKHDPFGGWLTFFPPEFKTWDEQKQFEMTLDMVIPWYMFFYLSWYYANKINNEIEVLWITYEELVTNDLNTLKKICDFYKIQKTDEEILNIINIVNQNKAKTRFNKGLIGRGQKILSEEQKNTIKEKTLYYPNVDFSAIGL